MAMTAKLLRHLPGNLKQAVISIGNFDGVHKGHQALLHAMKRQAAKTSAPTAVMLFEPHPQAFFSQNKESARLTRLREKFLLLTKEQIDYVLVIPFNKNFASLTAEAFIKTILIDKLNISAIIVGMDFRFGYKRKGDVTLLQQRSNNHFKVIVIPEYILDNERISSTRVRQVLLSADFAYAKKLLGRPYMINGRIIHGEERGRLLGFKTANIALHRKVPPFTGIFVARMHGITTKPLLGVASLGVRPAIGDNKLLLEVHLFNFNKSIYGHYVWVEFLHKIRDEYYFSSLSLLASQIAKDVEYAKRYFNEHGESDE